MSAGQLIAPQPNIGKTVVTYAAFLEAFQQDPGQIHDAVEKAAARVANGDPVMQQKLVAEWNNAIGALTKSAKPGLALEQSGGGVMHTPQNDMAARIQSMLVQQATAKGQVGTLHPAATVATPHGESFAPAVLFVKFDNDDIAGWLGMLPELIFKPPKAAWIEPSPVPEPIPDDARIAVFGDWGTGLYGAPAIAQSIVGLDRCDVVLHVGDTYYSGEDTEVHDRLVGDWPKRPAPTVNRSLNGNHEMYSGGKGYFQALADFFHQSASCFAMQNANWILVGLDTAYNDFDLDAKQVAWLEAIVAGAGTRKLILFSHHQPFSQLDDQGPKLQVALTNLLKGQRIHAWYWGHEHRLVIYDPHPVWGFKGRCIGNGGFPSLRDDLPGVGGDIYQFIKLAPQPFAPSATLLDGPNFWITQAPEQFSPHGYVFLQFDGASVSEIFRVPNNIGLLKQDV
jgi:hypothetical protein